MTRVHEKVHAFSEANWTHADKRFIPFNPGVRKFFKRLSHKEDRANAKRWMEVELDAMNDDEYDVE